MKNVRHAPRRGKAMGDVRPTPQHTRPRGIPLRILAPGAPSHLVVTGAGAAELLALAVRP